MTSRIPLPPDFSAGPFTVRAARSAGLSSSRLRGGDLRRPFHGVRDPDLFASDLQSQCRSYQPKMPTYAFFCGPTAARLVGVPLPFRLEQANVLHVAVPAPRRCPAGRGIVGHTIHGPDAEMCDWQGLRISSPERTWFDLGAALNMPDLIAATDFLIRRQSPLTTKRKLAAAIARYAGRRGRVVLREALELADERSESRKESQLRVILIQARFEGLVANLEISTSGGFHYRADLAFPKERALIEYQSDYHGDMAQFRADMTRRSRLEADGWTVVLVNADDLRNPEELVARIRRTLFEISH